MRRLWELTVAPGLWPSRLAVRFNAWLEGLPPGERPLWLLTLLLWWARFRVWLLEMRYHGPWRWWW